MNSKLFFSKFPNLIKRTFATEVNIVKSPIKPINIPQNVSINEFITKNFSKNANKTALICLESGREYKYEDVRKHSLAIAFFLRNKMNLKTGEVVAVNLPNMPEFPIIVLGALQAGLAVTTLNPIYTPKEIRHQIEDSRAKAVFTTEELAPTVQKSVQTIPIVPVTKGNLIGPHFAEIINGPLLTETVDVHTDATVLLPYSSGTTGLPKGVELTHANIIANLSQIDHELINFQMGDDHVIPAWLPLFHIYGLTIIMLHTLLRGNKLVTVPRFSSEALLRCLREQQPTVLYCVPLIINLMTNHPKIKLDNTSVQTVVSGAAPMGVSDIRRFEEKAKHKVRILQAYGMTETSPAVLSQTDRFPNGQTLGGTGVLVPNTEAKIISLDNDEINMGPNQSGEIAFRGPQVMKGYLNNHTANKSVFMKDGWLRTGDIGHYDENGHFFVTDRLKELIKVKGFQVAPAELEELLRSHPSIDDAAVCGIPHASKGEAPRAFVVLKNGQNLDDKEVKKFIADKVAKHKTLDSVVFLQAIPKSASGKILRRELKKL